MSRLSRLTGKEVARVVEKLGFVYSHTTGSHMVYKHSDGYTFAFYSSIARAKV